MAFKSRVLGNCILPKGKKKPSILMWKIISYSKSRLKSLVAFYIFPLRMKKSLFFPTVCQNFTLRINNYTIKLDTFCQGPILGIGALNKGKRKYPRRNKGTRDQNPSSRSQKIAPNKKISEVWSVELFASSDDLHHKEPDLARVSKQWTTIDLLNSGKHGSWNECEEEPSQNKNLPKW